MTRKPRHTASSSLHLRRLPRPGLVLGYGLGVAAVAAVAFLAGAAIRNPDQEAIAHVDERVAVTAEVVERSVSDSSLGMGTVTAGRSVAIQPAASDGARFVTAIGVTAGTKHTVPAFIGAVNDQPIFAVDFAIPLYRDLAFDATGPDVRSLRAALGLPAEGKVTSTVLDRVGAWYRQAGYAMPGGKGNDRIVQARDFTDIGAPSFTVGSIKAVGSPVTDDPLATLITSPNVVKLRVSMLDVETLKKGQPALISSGEKQLKAVVARIGGFAEGDDGVGGYDVTVSPTSAKEAATLKPGTQVSVERAGDVAASKAVPLQAIHQDGAAAYVLLPAASEQDAPRRIDVTVTGQGDGWAAIESDGLAVGARVLISD